MDDRRGPTAELEQLRRENERLRQELAAAGRTAARRDEVRAAADLGHAGRLAASEARHRFLIESWAQAVWETDATGVVVADSPSWRAYTGQTLEEWLGYGWVDAIHPDDRAYAERQWREAVAAHGLVDAEFRLRAPDGGWRWTNVRAAPVLDAGGRVEKWVGINIDIDARYRAEVALRKNEERHRTLFETIDEGYLLAEVVLDASGKPADLLFLEANPAAVRIAGRDFTGRRLREVDPDYEEYWVEVYGQVALTGEPIHAERYAAPHGRWFEFRASRVGGPGSWRVVVTFQDVTARHQAEAALRESEAKYRTLFQSIDEAFCVIEIIDGPDGRPADIAYIEANAALERQTGLKDIVGKRVSEVTPGTEAHWLEAYASVARTGEAKRFENYHADTGRWYDVYATRVGGPGRRQVCVVFRDTTERRENEERQAFLLNLSDALRPLADPGEIQAAATHLLRERFDGGWCYYVEFDRAGAVATVLRDSTRAGLPSFAGEHDVSDVPEFLELLRSGRVLNVPDYAGFEALSPRIRERYLALGFRSMLGAPLVKDGRCVALLLLGDTKVRPWPDSAVALVQETAERTWATVERARAEVALRESEARFRSFAQNSADVLWITNHDGTRLEYLSPAFERTFGEPPDRIIADLGRFLDLVHPEDREAVAGFMPRAMAGETAIAHYRVVRPRDGSIVHLRDTGFPIRDAAGSVVRVAGIVQDITDLQRAASAREAEKERFRTLAEGVPQLVWRAAPDGSWTWASPQWCDYTGQVAESSSGLGWLDAVHPDDRDAARAAWARAEDRGVYEAEFRVRRASSGAHAWFKARGVPLRAANGSPVEWIGACANIDEQVRAREALARNAEELERRVEERTGELMAAEESLRQSQKMEAIGQLTGGIAHDFNNMLQGVSGALVMAQRRLSEGRTPDVTRYMQAAGDAATRAAGLTRRLLAFARRQRLDPRPVDVDALIGGMGDLLRRTMGPSIAVGLELRDGAGQVLCDPSELEGAVLNLCINARDAMPQGGRLTIAITDVPLAAADIAPHEGAAAGDYVSIRIEDTGTGMTPEVLEHVLEPFFTTKPQGEGTGLGLSQVHGFVRQSGGLLRIASAPGRGTTMRILLPLTPAEAPSAGRGGPAQAAVQRSRGETVLMVDDEAAVREPAAEHLRDLGYRVVEANDGPTALRLLDEGLRPDVLVTDVGMPNGMDGRVVTEEARRRLPGLPVVFVTGYARVALPEEAAVVTKPFDLDLLARRLGFVFGRHP